MTNSWTSDELILMEENIEKSVTDLIKLLPRHTHHSIYRKKLELSGDVSAFKLSKEDQQQILEVYSLNTCVKETQKLLPHLHDYTISRFLKRSGIKTAGKENSAKFRKVYRSYIEKFPEDDKVLGYICGWIASDGNLNKKYKNIVVQLAIKDKEIIKFLALNLIDGEFRFRDVFNGTSHQSRFQATLPKLYQYCLDMGITPAKSLTLDVKLDDKSEDFKLYFLRGVIDGDGCVIVGKTLGSSIIAICSASEKFAISLQRAYGGTVKFMRNEHSGIYRIYFQGSKAKELAKILPLDDFTLTRKTDKLKAVLQQIFWNGKGKSCQKTGKNFIGLI